MRLQDRVALVTGAAQGIGRAIALTLAQNGADIAVADINAIKAEAVAKEVEGLGRRAVALEGSVSEAVQVEAMVSKAMEFMGHVDILVNNAGITRDALLLRMDEESWSSVMDINLKGAFLCTKAVLREMVRQRWGRIISLSSVVALVGNPGQANYAASKAGLIGFTKSVAREVASRNITVNAIAPGFIATDMTAALSEELQGQIRSRVAMGRFGTPEDVAHLIAFLASEEASYITGQVIGIDGGLGL